MTTTPARLASLCLLAAALASAQQAVLLFDARSAPLRFAAAEIHAALLGWLLLNQVLHRLVRHYRAKLQ